MQNFRCPRTGFAQKLPASQRKSTNPCSEGLRVKHPLKYQEQSHGGYHAFLVNKPELVPCSRVTKSEKVVHLGTLCCYRARKVVRGEDFPSTARRLPDLYLTDRGRSVSWKQGCSWPRVFQPVWVILSPNHLSTIINTYLCPVLIYLNCKNRVSFPT